MAPTLLVLAAGMGSRYGGLKQVDPVGPSGETVLDYAVFDALRAGFGRVVFVIRRDFEETFRSVVGDRYAGHCPVDYAFQALDDLPVGFAAPEGRQKPWGTGHAVWCARKLLTGPFAAINADDFYGADSFRQLSGFLTGARGLEFAMVGFKLGNTLSEHGPVARGVCERKGDWMASIREETGLTRERTGPGKEFSGDELVSMNCWGFTPDLFPGLEAAIGRFFSKAGSDPKAEIYLPSVVSEFVASGRARVKVLPTSASWFGVTYREDKPRVTAAIEALVKAGEYPASLFGRGQGSALGL